MARKIARADKERPGGPPEGADERLEEAEAAIEKLRPPYDPLGTDNVMKRRQRVAFGNDGKFRWPEGVQNLWVENKVKWLKSLKGKFVPRGAKPWDPPKFKFVCVNVRLSAKQSSNTKIVNQVVDEMRRITGRHPFFNRCSVNSQHTGFRAGQICGVSVRLSGKLMNDFLNRLNTIVLPRVRDFEGLWPNSFTNHGDYWFSLPDQECFRELDEVLDQREITHPIDIGIVNNRFTQPDGLKMMKDFGFPFRDDLKPPRGWVHNPRVFRGKKPKMEKGRTGMHKKSR
jgi:large subunit ribosomal protein L5